MSKEITRAESKHWQSHNNNPEILIMWGKKTILKWNRYWSKRNFNGNLVEEISYEYKICIIYVYNIKCIWSSQAYFFKFEIYMCYIYIYIHIQTYVHIHTHMYTVWKNTLKYMKKYISMNRENHLLEIHPLVLLTKETVNVLWPRKLENGLGKVVTTEVVTTSLKLNAGTLLIGHFHLEVTRMILFIDPSSVGFA